MSKQALDILNDKSLIDAIKASGDSFTANAMLESITAQNAERVESVADLSKLTKAYEATTSSEHERREATDALYRMVSRRANAHIVDLIKTLRDLEGDAMEVLAAMRVTLSNNPKMSNSLPEERKDLVRERMDDLVKMVDIINHEIVDSRASITEEIDLLTHTVQAVGIENKELHDSMISYLSRIGDLVTEIASAEKFASIGNELKTALAELDTRKTEEPHEWALRTLSTMCDLAMIYSYSAKIEKDLIAASKAVGDGGNVAPLSSLEDCYVRLTGRIMQTDQVCFDHPHAGGMDDSNRDASTQAIKDRIEYIRSHDLHRADDAANKVYNKVFATSV